MKINEFFKYWRQKHGLTLRETANLLGYKTLQAISQIERGKVDLSVQDMIKLRIAICTSERESKAFSKQLTDIILQNESEK